MMAVVRAFENTEYTLGRDGTIFFFLEYLNYLDEVNAELENTERLVTLTAFTDGFYFQRLVTFLCTQPIALFSKVEILKF